MLQSWLSSLSRYLLQGYLNLTFPTVIAVLNLFTSIDTLELFLIKGWHSPLHKNRGVIILRLPT